MIFYNVREVSYYTCGFSFKVITDLRSLPYLSFRKAFKNSGESPDTKQLTLPNFWVKYEVAIFQGLW